MAAARLEGRLSRASIRAAYDADDLQEIAVTRPGGRRAHILYLPVLVDAQKLQNDVIAPLVSSPLALRQALPRASRVGSRSQADELLLRGAALAFSGRSVCCLMVQGSPGRNVDEPSTERAVFGPKDAFVEALDQNIALIRRHLRDPRLQVQRLTIGRDATTRVAVLHVHGMADPAMVDVALHRLQEHRPARVGFVTSLLRPLFGAVWASLLPADFTERPYRVADLLYRGRVAVLADGSPYALVAPVTFPELFMDEEEYLQATATRWFVRFLRGIAFCTALMVPGLYLAVLTVNTTIMPGLLAIAVSSNRQSLPYPIVIETFLMLIVLDIMAEATVSMKGVLGPAISIVGSLIVGQAAVRANLASNLGVILLALTALATFITPRYHLTYATRVLKYPVMLISGLFGIIGWATALIALLAYFNSMRSLGIPLSTPLAPARPSALSSVSPSGADAGGAAPPARWRPRSRPE